jgi:hypothetical protein
MIDFYEKNGIIGIPKIGYKKSVMNWDNVAYPGSASSIALSSPFEMIIEQLKK